MAVIGKFVVASILMWALPQFILKAFKHELIPGVSNLSPEAHTLWSGFLAVLSVNIVIGGYIYLAFKEPPTASTPEPDPVFVNNAMPSLEQQEEQEDEASKKHN